ncbi:sensor histidine kinase [Marinagarivorans cellulosilyticus]|uniref:histidine kinase n=1 Tax=Marinagarivorans cellulosilyticus TaxID=2721545 RepID=A0AAN1WIN2_9GAMM|nr:ATP-binding protein [Marinagarivorans cellulosilyticus]BCD98316.1 two-component system, sensor histidine kinase FlrB [Marinagarivorans cellulosilyticus]
MQSAQRDSAAPEENLMAKALHTQALMDGDVRPPSVEQLSDAFEFFNSTSTQLGRSYQLLEERVARLTQELDEVSAEKQEANEEKAQLAQRLQKLLDLLPGGIIVIDARGCIVQSNPAAQKMLDNKLDGALWRDIIGECFAPRGDDGLEISTRAGRRVSMATSSLDDEGQIILLTDQTETRKLQQKVSRYEKLSAMGKMVSALAHQIRTPLSAAMLYADHLTNDSLTPENHKKFASKIQGRLQHMEKQVRDMLLFVRNELPLNDVVTLADLESGIRAAAEVTLATSKSYCIFVNPLASTRIRCNREALISAVGNLINNAVQARAGGVNIALRFDVITLDDTPSVRISVVDDGPGMTDEQLHSAKELFYTSKAQGTGLGLAVVQSVARAHGGYMSLQSGVSVGTKARIYLPLNNVAIPAAANTVNQSAEAL